MTYVLTDEQMTAIQNQLFALQKLHATEAAGLASISDQLASADVRARMPDAAEAYMEQAMKDGQVAGNPNGATEDEGVAPTA